MARGEGRGKLVESALRAGPLSLSRRTSRGAFGALLGWLCAVCLFPPTGAAPDLARMRFTPPVVPQTQTDPVRFEATVTEHPASVAFEYDGTDRNMYDDGTHGDRVAGDDTWTLLFPPSEILGKLTPARVYRPFLGYCKPAGGGRYNIFAEIWTPDIGLASVEALGPGAQQTDYLVNLAASESELMSFDATHWGQRFYALYGDDFDFINFLHIAGRRGNRYHIGVRNDVQGIGLALYDGSAAYGSAGRLRGCNVFPVSSFFDAGETAFSHETGHQWINFLHGTPFDTGIPHWPRGDIAINMMGFSIPGSGAGGTYNYTFTPEAGGGFLVGAGSASNQIIFNSMELYLMGLLPPADVETFFVLKDQNQELTVGQILPPAQITRVTVSDVIAACGHRVPSSSSSQKVFRVATVVLSEGLLDAYSMSFYDWFARRAEARQPLSYASGFSTGTCNPFFLATGGRSEFISRIKEDAQFRRGEANADGSTDISDAVSILGFLFLGSVMNDCEDAADINDDGVNDISDAVALLGYLFLGGPQPQAPFGACGDDATGDELDCRTFSGCP